MKFGIVGLGRIGGNLALQALGKGHEVVGYAESDVPDELQQKGMEVADRASDVAARLSGPRVIFSYVPAGEATEAVADELAGVLLEGDVFVDGGNSHWRDSVRRYEAFRERGLKLLDCGTSGGVPGARNGACFMVGGDEDAYTVVEPLLKDLAVEDGYFRAGPAGAGHFVKLMHNMVEFGMVQAIGEGVELLQRSDYDLDLQAVMHNWNHGSVVRSWLVELMERGFAEHGDDLGSVKPYVADTGEQVWGVDYAMEKEVPIPLISQAVWGFYGSRDADRPSDRGVAVMRNQYGAHPLEES